MDQLELAEEMPITVVATAAVGDFPEVETRYILDVHTQDLDLRLLFSDPEPLRLLRRAATALLRESRRRYSSQPVTSHAFTRRHRPATAQTHLDLALLDDDLL